MRSTSSWTRRARVSPDTRLAARGRTSNGRIRFESGFAWRSPGSRSTIWLHAHADEINQFTWAGTTSRSLLDLQPILPQHQSVGELDYAGEHTSTMFNANSNVEFKNRWRWIGDHSHARLRLVHQSQGGPPPSGRRAGRLRRGPLRSSPLGHADARHLPCGRDEGSYAYREVGWADSQPTRALRFTLLPDYMWMDSNVQYVTQESYGRGTLHLRAYPPGDRLTHVARRLLLAPDLTIQYYAQPFISNGQYGEFRRITTAGR